MKVLIVEDHAHSRRALAVALRLYGYAVDEAESLRAAIGLLGVSRYDALLVDIQLPEGPSAGVDLVRWLRDRRSPEPVLFLTGRGALEDRVAGLDAGGDVYLVKPCHPREVDANIRATLRRMHAQRVTALRRGLLEMDWEARSVRLDGAEVRLTRKEFAVLELLATCRGRYFLRHEIIERVWDERFDGDERVVTTYIKTLRGKLGRDVIETSRNLGYRFSPR